MEKETKKYAIKLKYNYNDILEDINKTIYPKLSMLFPMKDPPNILEDYNKMLCVEKGDVIVRYVYEWLSNIDDVCDLLNTSGISNNSYDIIIRTKNDGNLRGIQVKTLSPHDIENDTWRIALEYCDYPKDTLMIFANLQKTRFCVTLWEDISHCKKKLVLGFNKRRSRYDFIKFTDFECAKQKIVQLLYKSVIINDIREGIRSTSDLKEYDSLRNIKRLCDENDIKFEYNYTNGNYVDIYLNGYACQCKFSGYKHGQHYQCSLAKKVKSIHVPYDNEDNIDYFLFQIEDAEDDLLIIPKETMIERGYIKTNKQYGNTRFTFASYGYPSFHWTESFWNDFSIIQNGYQATKDPVYNFTKKYNCVIRNATPHAKAKDTYSATITKDDMDINFKYLLILANNRKEKIHKDKIFVISKEDYIKSDKYPKGTQTAKPLYIALPGGIQHWTSRFWIDVKDLDNI